MRVGQFFPWLFIQQGNLCSACRGSRLDCARSSSLQLAYSSVHPAYTSVHPLNRHFNFPHLSSHIAEPALKIVHLSPYCHLPRPRRAVHLLNFSEPSIEPPPASTFVIYDLICLLVELLELLFGGFLASRLVLERISLGSEIAWTSCV